MSRRWAAMAIAFWFIFIGWLSLPQRAWAAEPLEPVPLTASVLKARVQAPVQREGAAVIDLRRFIIDLRPDSDTSVRDAFYRLLQEPLRQSSPSIGLDLSYSIVKGELDLSELGTRVPLYSPTLPPVFSEAEQQQLQRDRRRLVQLGQLSRSLLIQTPTTPLQISLIKGPLRFIQTSFEGPVSLANTFFQSAIEADGSRWGQALDMTEARFGQAVRFVGASFNQEVIARNSIFFSRVSFNQSQFRGLVSFQGSDFFGAVNVTQAIFQQAATLTDATWHDTADFGQTRWQKPVLFNKSQFLQALFLTRATFEEPVIFRETRFSEPINLRNGRILTQADFGDATFLPGAYLNVSGLEFNADDARILGNPGRIGRALSVPTLQGNETLLRNLVRNFRQLEQIADANQVEYLSERLRLRQLWKQLTAINVNTASLEVLRSLGLTQTQAEAIAQSRDQQPFQRVPDLLKLDALDLTTYVSISPAVVAIAPRTITTWAADALHWLGLGLLLVLTRYGTSSGLIFSTGLLLTAYFGALFWLVDRFRKLRPCPIVPRPGESLVMGFSSSLLGLISLIAIFRISESPWLTLTCLGLLSLPVPLTLVGLIYWQGRYHDLMDSSYFVEDGSARQLRLLIGRLPIIPKFPFFRERFTPILWDRRWNWLNYYDFSLINLIKFGFNDIRLRDQEMPGLISGLAWYQWGLGLLYISLLLWTLSRTIPGLNLLIYFK